MNTNRLPSLTKPANLVVTVLCVLGFLLPACGEDPPPRRRGAQQQAAAPAPGPAPAPAPADGAGQEAEAEAEEELVEEVVVKRFRPARDPFQSVFESKKRIVSDITHPLQQFSIGQLKLLGIIWGIAEPVALVSTPGNNEYIIKTGTPVGTGDGKVVAILPDRVVIVERYYDYRGQLQTEKYELVLPTRE